MQKRRLLVIGGGAAGMASAITAAEHGLDVYIVEKEENIGGRAYHYCCKATDKCNKCAVCLVNQMKTQVEKNSQITVYCGSEVVNFSNRGDFYSVGIRTEQEEIGFEVAAVIIATGFEPFDPTLKKELHYGFHQNVITALELEKNLFEKGSLIRAFGELKNIGFIQCVGSRDLALGNNYCSKVCCMYASKLAKLIRAEMPNVELSIFYMDLQTFGRGFDEFIRSCKEEDNINFIRGIPSKVFSFPYERLTAKYADSLTGETLEDNFDLIVLSTAITPGKDTEKLAKLFNVDIDEHGFFATELLNSVKTNKEAIFVAGACQSPKDIPHSIEQGKAAVNALLNYLKKQ